MEEVLNNKLESFERVWQRVVSGGSDCKAPKDTLRELMDAERASNEFYIALSRLCSNPFRSTISKIAADEAQHLRELQLEYYLLVGDSYAPPESCPRLDGVLSALRIAYFAEKKASAEYLAAAECDQSERSALYRRIAGEELCHAETLRKMIERAI